MVDDVDGPDDALGRFRDYLVDAPRTLGQARRDVRREHSLEAAGWPGSVFGPRSPVAGRRTGVRRRTPATPPGDRPPSPSAEDASGTLGAEPFPMEGAPRDRS